MPFLAAGAGIGAIGSIVGGGKQAKAAKEAAQTQAAAANHASDLQNEHFQATLQNETPFMNLGNGAADRINGNLDSLTAGFNPSAAGLSPNFSYNQSDFQNDPAFAAAMKYGTQAIERSAAAKGNLLSPATAKALQSYGQDTAQQYYGQDYSRAQQTYQQNYGNAFNTFTANQNGAFGKLAQLASLGQNAASQTGVIGGQAATAQGNALMSAGNSQSAGIIGAANAQANGFGGAAANFAQLLGNSNFQSFARGNGSGSSYQQMTPYTPNYPVNGSGI